MPRSHLAVLARYTVALSAAAAGFGFAGCTKPLNNLDPQIAGGEPILTPESSPAPSVTGLSRDNWPSIAVGWDTGRILHGAAMPMSVAAWRAEGRQRGHFPTLLSVADEKVHRRERAREGLIAHPHALAIIALSPWEVIKGRAPWTTENSPAAVYDRVPVAPMDETDIGIRPAMVNTPPNEAPAGR